MLKLKKVLAIVQALTSIFKSEWNKELIKKAERFWAY